MRALAGVLLLLTSACTIGPRPGEYAPDATGPHGVFGTLTIRGGEEVRVELIEVRDTSLVVLGPEGYALAHFDRIRAVDMPPHYSSSQFSALRARARLRPASRFPHGIPPGVLDELLRSANQTALTVLTPRR